MTKLVNWFNGTSGAWRKTVIAATTFYTGLGWWLSVTFNFTQPFSHWLLGFTVWGSLVWMLKNLVHAAVYRAAKQLYDEQEGQRPTR